MSQATVLDNNELKYAPMHAFTNLLSSLSICNKINIKSNVNTVLLGSS